jgi:predicted dehydrogenase
VEALRWGVLSTARIATEKVIPGMRRAGRADVVAIASRDAATARRVAGALGIAVAHASYEALLADPSVDAVYVPLPNHLHAEWTIRALEAGKHVLCEKPIALTVADAERMVEASIASGRILAEAFMYRHHPSWRLVKALVEEGRIGRLTAIDSWFSYFLDDPTNIRNVLAYGGGALLDIGCYSVNLSRWLFGGEPTAVSAAIVRDEASGVDILTTGHMVFPAGLASFTCATRVEPDQRVHVYGTDGRISIEIPFNIPPLLPSRVFVTQGGDPPVAPATETIELAPADPYACEVDAFAAVALDGEAPAVPLADAVENLRTIERLLAAAGQGIGGR